MFQWLADFLDRRHVKGVEKRRGKQATKIAAMIYARTKLTPAKPDPKEQPLEAVRQNGLALGYIEDQTPELCMEAVRQNPLAFFWVKDKTEELCREAVGRLGWLICFIPDPSPELCLVAVKNDWRALLHIKKQTHEMCRIAVGQCPAAALDILDSRESLVFCASTNEAYQELRSSESSRKAGAK